MPRAGGELRAHARWFPPEVGGRRGGASRYDSTVSITSYDTGENGTTFHVWLPIKQTERAK